MQNTECKMQNAKCNEHQTVASVFHILHFAFCIQYFAFDPREAAYWRLCRLPIRPVMSAAFTPESPPLPFAAHENLV